MQQSITLKNEKIAARKEALAKLWTVVSKAIQPVIHYARLIDEPFILESLTKRDNNIITHFLQKSPALLSELFERCFEQTPRQSKIFSFYRNAVDCFNKNKHHKGLEFGRQFQIGRVGGNLDRKSVV